MKNKTIFDLLCATNCALSTFLHIQNCSESDPSSESNHKLQKTKKLKSISMIPRKYRFIRNRFYFSSTKKSKKKKIFPIKDDDEDNTPTEVCLTKTTNRLKTDNCD